MTAEKASFKHMYQQRINNFFNQPFIFLLFMISMVEYEVHQPEHTKHQQISHI